MGRRRDSFRICHPASLESGIAFGLYDSVGCRRFPLPTARARLQVRLSARARHYLARGASPVRRGRDRCALGGSRRERRQCRGFSRLQSLARARNLSEVVKIRRKRDIFRSGNSEKQGGVCGADALPVSATTRRTRLQALFWNTRGSHERQGPRGVRPASGIVVAWRLPLA